MGDSACQPAFAEVAIAAERLGDGTIHLLGETEIAIAENAISMPGIKSSFATPEAVAKLSAQKFVVKPS